MLFSAPVLRLNTPVLRIAQRFSHPPAPSCLLVRGPPRHHHHHHRSLLPLSQSRKMSAAPPSAPQPEKQANTSSSSSKTPSDFTPDPSASLPLPPSRQALLDDILALYCCKPSVERVRRYTPDCIYDDPFGYADNRYKVAGQWFALPKLFSASENTAYQVVRSDDEVLQFKSAQKWTFRLLPKSVTLKSLITLTLEPESLRGDFLRVKHHKDQNSDNGPSHEGIWFTVRKWQADNMPGWIGMDGVKQFEEDNKPKPAEPIK